MRVSLSKSDRSFSVLPGQAVLDAAVAAGLNLPHSCRGGNCGACCARLLEGEVAYPNGRPMGLSDAQTDEGFILLCQARARSDLRIETIEVSTPEDAVIKRLPCRIERVARMSPDVMRLELRLPAVEAFRFQPGQHLDIILPGGGRRSFSIASPPHDARPLELHVRRVPDGEFTEPLFAGAGAGRLLTIEGPLGHFVYRDGAAPLLLVGGGTGLAPLYSILRHVIDRRLQRDVRLYWGVRATSDLYLDAELRAMIHRAGAWHYQPVLSEPDAGWSGLTGLVHEAVLGAVPRLDVPDVYAAGPPAMIAAVRREFVLHGADPARLHVDSFDYATDPRRRQRTSAATKS